MPVILISDSDLAERAVNSNDEGGWAGGVRKMIKPFLWIFSFYLRLVPLVANDRLWKNCRACLKYIAFKLLQLKSSHF